MDFFKDVELSVLLKAIKNNEDADSAFAELLCRYEPMMVKRVSSMFGSTSDTSEAMQEANIALHSAAITYDKEKCEGVSFGLYAGVCVCNRLRSMIRRRKRELAKAEPISDEQILGASESAESFVLTRDLCERVMNLARLELSDFEYNVFRLEFEGYTTRDIAKKLSKDSKAVDNAKYRISRRLRKNEEICSIISDI